MPPNTSATGGYLPPDPSTSPINGQELNRFLQTFVVGVTGLVATLVRPRWQKEPPNLPAVDTDWCAIGVVSRQNDTFSAEMHNPADAGGLGTDTVYRQQVLDVLASFYGPNAENFADILSMGVQVGQNREVLLLAGFGVVEVGDPVSAPELVKNLWLNRIDVHMKLRRAEARTYAVENVLSAVGEVDTDAPARTVPIAVSSS